MRGFFVIVTLIVGGSLSATISQRQRVCSALESLKKELERTKIQTFEEIDKDFKELSSRTNKLLNDRIAFGEDFMKRFQSLIGELEKA